MTPDELRDTFVARAGGVFTYYRAWHHLASREKHALLWDYYASADTRGAAALYSGASVRELRAQRRHSIEHVVPRAVLRRWLGDARRRVRNGACANPLNLTAEDSRVNSLRGDVPFDLDGDTVRTTVRVRGGAPAASAVGLDAEGQWVPPLRSRGDIARTVLYMTLVYRLPIPLDARWLAWLRADPPSETERAFSRWTRARWRIGNPLVEDPEALEMLLFALNWS
jgi:endonuclease I